MLAKLILNHSRPVPLRLSTTRCASTIPYHPSLALGQIVHDEVIELVDKISEVRAPIAEKQDNLNDINYAYRSMMMTQQELVADEIVPTEQFSNTLKDLATKRQSLASDLATIRADKATEILELKKELRGIMRSIESPIDYSRLGVKYLPLSSDSINLTAQYFSFDGNKESSEATIGKIKSWVTGSSSFLGAEVSGKAGAAAQDHAIEVSKNHDVEGTLVISAGCTHKNVAILDPMVIEPDKAIRSWNSAYDGADEIQLPEDVQKIARSGPGSEDEKRMRILTGAAYGSSFVSLVHILKADSTISSQEMNSRAAAAQAQAKWGNWFSKYSGGFGMEASFSKDIKSLLSKQNIQAQISLICMGCVPTIKSNSIKIGVERFSDFEPDKMMDKLSVLANNSQSDMESFDEAAESARTGGQMMSIRREEIHSVMSGLGEYDDGQNKLLDINTVMNAVDDYATLVKDMKGGVPINYYTRDLTKYQIARLWADKYFPETYMTKYEPDETTS